MTAYADRIGRVICGRYRIDGVIGAGGFGVVYRAINLAVGQPVAMKLMLGEHVSDARQVARFEREAMSVSSLRAPNTIRVFDFGRDEEGNLFLVMELLNGLPLSTILTAIGQLAPRRAVHIAMQIAKSLAEAHEAGIVHRDLKPDNIFIADLPGEEDYVKVLDFGIAKLVGENVSISKKELTRAGAVIGTPTYMSPEQARGAQVDARSDLYSLGCVLFRMLAGRPPFEAASALALAFAHNEEPIPDVELYEHPDDPIDVALASLVRQLLAKDPKHRPLSARAVIAALSGAPAAAGTPTNIMRATPLPQNRLVDPEAATVELDAPTPAPPSPAPKAPPAAPVAQAQPDEVRRFIAGVDARPTIPKPALPPAAAVSKVDPALVERAATKLAQSLGPIARVLAKKMVAKAADDGDFVRLMAEQLDTREREPYMDALLLKKK